MLPTPDTSHVPYQRVYEPAEDSFLLLDTLSSPSETAFLSSRFGNSTTTTTTTTTQQNAATPTPLVLEVGPGSGVVIAFLTANARTIFGTPHLLTLAVDVNRFACVATEQTVSRAVADTDPQKEAEAGTFLTPLQGDLTTPLRAHQVDVLVFNPPYVPTPDLPAPPAPSSFSPSPSTGAGPEGTGEQQQQKPTFAQDSHLLELSYAGGKDGMETTDRLIDALPGVLSERGCAYILLCAQNRPEEVKERIRMGLFGGEEGGEQERERGGKWMAETVGVSGKQAGWEKLQIVRVWRDVA